MLADYYTYTSDSSKKIDSKIAKLLNEFQYWDLGTGATLPFYEKDGVVKAEVPGYNKTNIEISVKGDVLSVRSLKKDEANKTLYSFSAPKSVDLSSTTAKVEDGILTINLPKLKREEPKRILIE